MFKKGRIVTEEQKAKIREVLKNSPRVTLDEKVKVDMAKDYRTEKPLPRPRAIREKCMNCCGWQRNEVLMCTSYSCPLWPHRASKASQKKFNPQLTAEDK
jgi:hypothetical protein